MPSNTYTNPGNSSWTAPFATRKVIARVVGGGGSGYRDCDGDDEGGGGGGGGYSDQTRNVKLELLVILVYGLLNLSTIIFLLNYN